jgi:hypothetical protein
MGGTHITCCEMRDEYIILVGKSERKRPLGILGLDTAKTILMWVMKKQDVMVWTGCIWSRIGTSSWLL